MRPRFFTFAALITFSSLAGADCSLSPLNGVSQKQENPVWVEGHRFGTAAYSYFVDSYHIVNFHCSKSINEGPRAWDIIVNSGHVEVNGEPKGNGQPRRTDRAATFPNLPALRGLTSLKDSQRALPSLPNPEPLSGLAPLSNASGVLPNLPDLSPLRP